MISLPAPLLPPEELVRTGDTGLFWTTPGAPVHAGIGAARRGKARYVLLERIGRVSSDPDWSRELRDDLVDEVVKSVLARPGGA